MRKVHIFLFLASTLSLDHPSSVSGDLSKYLRHYETFHVKQLRHKRTKRDAANDERVLVKQLEFRVLNRDFHLYLERNTGILSDDFEVVTVGDAQEKAGKKHPIHEANINVFNGFVIGQEESSSVQAVWENKDELTVTITTQDDIYSLEPSWRHLPESDNYTSIAYRRSDMKNLSDLGQHFCGSHHDESWHPQDPPEDIDQQSTDNSRKRRDTSEEQISQAGSTAPLHGQPAVNTCPILLVADYKFFEQMGQGSVYRTSNYLIGLLDRVDTIFRRTNFNGYTNMGFEVKKILIHEHPNTVDSSHYNYDRQWVPETLIESFSRPDYKDVCLAHLFTYHSFYNGVLGLAYISIDRKGIPVKGICSTLQNTGWTTTVNKYGHKLLTQQADLVTTHEFGHNWGSRHDPDSQECSPYAQDGGKYVMYTYSVTGYDTNNKYFSPCSKRAIRTALGRQVSACFKEKQSHFCGNKRVERPQEECDVGSKGAEDNNPCCGSDCKLKPGKQCSDWNDVCCQNCTFAPSTVECYKGHGTVSCYNLTYCTGTDGSCPKLNIKEDGTECSERGKCMKGECLPFCKTMGMISCVCDKVEEACNWCCQKHKTGSCKPYLQDGVNETIDLPDGTPCIQGTCDKGQCKKMELNILSKISNLFENITPGQLVYFMRTNIVGTVIVLSLIVWVPASCAFSWMDRKKQQKEQDEMNDFDMQSQLLLDYASLRRSQRSLQRRYKPNPGAGGASAY